METKTFFDAWLETQKELMTNWSDSNRKLQDAVKNGTAAAEGVNIYNEWLTKQAAITENATEKAAKNLQPESEAIKNAMNGNPSGIADIYKNWMNTQRQVAEKAFETFRNSSQPFAAQNPFANNWTSQFQNFPQNLWSNAQNMMNQSPDFSKQWFENFSNWGKGINDSTLKDAWSKMTNSADAYVKFFENWAPAFKNMNMPAFNNEWLKNSFNPEAFREMMDRSMGAFTPLQTKEFFSQFQSWTEVITNYNRHIYHQTVGNMPENLKNLTPFLLFNNDTTNPFNNVFAAYQRAVTPLLSVFNPGKENQINEATVTLLDKLSVYGQKLAILQQQMYATGAQTWETFLTENSEALKKGADLSNGQQVFQSWVAKNEQAFIELFQGEEYSKLQGELLDLSLEIRMEFEKIAESALKPLPVVLRSEANELYTTIYELRKRVSALEKQLEDAEVKDPKTARKKTATA
ncbi:MAG TPA: poly(R)-hydroxyalkanoic acid synthase subunit PhaE [Bacteroidia bacterium]|nr:poly(R)-hydroxyalkanoic acid synthase subunit PhaE [Bacteroidia bacterium]